MGGQTPPDKTDFQEERKNEKKTDTKLGNKKFLWKKLLSIFQFDSDAFGSTVESRFRFIICSPKPLPDSKSCLPNSHSFCSAFLKTSSLAGGICRSRRLLRETRKYSQCKVSFAHGLYCIDVHINITILKKCTSASDNIYSLNSAQRKISTKHWFRNN